MAAGSQRAILLFTGLLILISIIVISLDENSSNNIIFVVIFSTSIIILLWKILSTQTKAQEQNYSSTVNLEKISTNQGQKISQPIIENNVPDPLDKELDLPLM
tara:strand:- start:633 stop:941 length:309 start_codon:yes stop_codon:yes gene_type:complete